MSTQPIVRPERFSGKSVAALVLSAAGTIPCFWLWQLPGLIGAVMGFVGLREVRDGSRRGRGLAIAAIVIGLALVVLAVVLAIVFATSSDCEFHRRRFECNFD
jgi:uncharacterized membrane protein